MSAPDAADLSWVRHAAERYARYNHAPATALCVPDAVIEFYGRPELKAAAAAVGVDLRDRDGRPL